MKHFTFLACRSAYNEQLNGSEFTYIYRVHETDTPYEFKSFTDIDVRNLSPTQMEELAQHIFFKIKDYFVSYWYDHDEPPVSFDNVVIAPYNNHTPEYQHINYVNYRMKIPERPSL